VGEKQPAHPNRVQLIQQKTKSKKTKEPSLQRQHDEPKNSLFLPENEESLHGKWGMGEKMRVKGRSFGKNNPKRNGWVRGEGLLVHAKAKQLKGKSRKSVANNLKPTGRKWFFGVQRIT